MFTSPGGGIGRHKGLKIPRRKLRAGSSPAPGTILRILMQGFLVDWHSNNYEHFNSR